MRSGGESVYASVSLYYSTIQIPVCFIHNRCSRYQRKLRRTQGQKAVENRSEIQCSPGNTGNRGGITRRQAASGNSYLFFAPSRGSTWITGGSADK